MTDDKMRAQERARRLERLAELSKLANEPTPEPLTEEPKPQVSKAPSHAAPTWALWRPIPGVELPYLKVWEACAMSLDITPDSLKFRGDAWMGDTGEASDRMRAPPIRVDSFPTAALERVYFYRLPDGHPNSPTSGHLKVPPPEVGVTMV